jgi:hypothetical protein
MTIMIHLVPSIDDPHHSSNTGGQIGDAVREDAIYSLSKVGMGQVSVESMRPIQH